MADNEGWTTLHFSAKNGSYELFKYFVDMGSCVHLKTVDGKNCLHTAALNGNLSLVSYLRISIIFMCIWLAMTDGHHFIMPQAVAAIN